MGGGVREDGTLKVSGGSGGAAVDIVSPLGSQSQANSVSTTPSADSIVTDSITALNDFVQITIPDGYNSVIIHIPPHNLDGSLVFFIGTIVNGILTFAQNQETLRTINLRAYSGVGVDEYYAIPAVPGQSIGIACVIYTSGSITNIELAASLSNFPAIPISNEDLKNTFATTQINTELPPAVALSDGQVNPTAPAVGSFGMVWTGVSWDRIPGSSSQGVKCDTELPIANFLADGSANPSVPGVGSYGMIFDGATWDRMPGNSATGLLVNSGVTFGDAFTGTEEVFIASVIDTDTLTWSSLRRRASAPSAGTPGLITRQVGLPDESILVDNTPNPTLTKIQTFPMMFDGSNWDMIRGTSADGLLVSTNVSALSSVSGSEKIFPNAIQDSTAGAPFTWRVARARTDAPPVGELGLITRNIPSGTQTINGTVTTKTDLTPSSPTAASVGVASAQVVAANATRKGLVLVNTSSARISLGFGAAAVLDSGITLFPGGVFEMEEYEFDVSAVNAIASTAASNLAIQEYST